MSCFGFNVYSNAVCNSPSVSVQVKKNKLAISAKIVRAKLDIKKQQVRIKVKCDE